MYVSRTKAVVVLVALLVVAGAAAGLPAAAGAQVVGPADPGLELTATPGVVRSDQATKLAAHIAVPGATLQLSREFAGESGFTPLRTQTADAQGDVSWRLSLARTATYRVEFAGDATWAAATADATVRVRPKLVLSVTGSDSVFTGDRLTVRLRVSPAHPGGTVDLQLWDGKAAEWTQLSTLTLGGDSRASCIWRPDRPGRLRIRAHMAADVDHVSGWSPPWKQRVLDPRNPYGVPAKPAHLIVVDLSEYHLYYHEHGRIVRSFDCVLGRPSLPTPRGHFRIYAMDAHMYGPYGPRRMRYLGAYAIHGTNEPWLLSRFPRNFSHGCTRLSNANILWLFDRCDVGTQVWNVP